MSVERRQYRSEIWPSGSFKGMSYHVLMIQRILKEINLSLFFYIKKKHK